MVVIDKVLISDDVLKERFVCDLGSCKGGCCEDGDSGAPLDAEELDVVEWGRLAQAWNDHPR